jgi:hypothetical protein
MSEYPSILTLTLTLTLISGGKTVTEDYLARALRAELLFHYHPVYNPLTKVVESFMPHTAGWFRGNRGLRERL